jgi:DNA-binding NarL/FixJ family response regulator
MIQVVLADDHVLMRRGIRDLLEVDPEIEVIAEAGDGREAAQLARKFKPHVLIIDLLCAASVFSVSSWLMNSEQKHTTETENREVAQRNLRTRIFSADFAEH